MMLSGPGQMIEESPCPPSLRRVGAGLATVKVRSVMSAVRLIANGVTVATVGWPQADFAVVKLAPTDQKALVAEFPSVRAELGVRGRKGVTHVNLREIDEAVAKRLLVGAWRQAQTARLPHAKAG